MNHKSGFKAPEGYFENFADRIMDQLPEPQPESTPTVTLWMKIRPILYMAAMFAGIILSLKLFTTQTPKEETPLAFSSAVEELSDEEFAIYATMDEYSLMEYLYEQELQ